MKLVKISVVILFCLVICSAMKRNEQTSYSIQTLETFQKDAASFAGAMAELKMAAGRIEKGNKQQVAAAREALKECRLRYKRIEFFMEYFFEYPVNMYNRAPVYEVEEPYMEYQSPIGLQVVEGLLMDENVFEKKKELTDQCDVISTTANDIPATLYKLHPDDGQILEAIRLELVRIITLGITGYDAPQLKTGIRESAEALGAVLDNLRPLLEKNKSNTGDSVLHYLQKSIDLLSASTGFDDFNRLDFLTDAALPLQQHLAVFLKQTAQDLNTHDALNYDAAHLFRRDALNLQSFLSDKEVQQTPQLAALGRELFYEKALSGNGQRSCGTCHQPDKYFTDGLVKSKALDGKGEVIRNAPTLYYAAYQRMQFHDGRAGSLEEQIKAVLQNPAEMNADLQQVVEYLNKSSKYEGLFKEAFSNTGNDSTVSIKKLATALAAYEQTLAPFSSPFDDYINGNRQAMTTAQKKGFNLFMGKGQCATCHFAPLFNGLLPPYYERTELEVLGVPQQGNVRRPRPDTDSGRYRFFAISFNNGAFKTSTVRNSAVTAPYMHNGAFRTLKQVIDFYNKGGGAGMGLKTDHQTLSDIPLELSAKEIQQLTAFLESLTDKPLPQVK